MSGGGQLKAATLPVLLLLLLLIDLPGRVLSDYGGHDLFTSLAQLEVLWHNERKVVGEMEELRGKNDNVTAVIDEYVA